MIGDLQRSPDISEHGLRYLSNQKVTKNELSLLLDLWRDSNVSSEQLIGITRFLCDAGFAFGEASEILANFATARIVRVDNRPRGSYARALLILLLYKHGNRRQRDRILKWGTSARIKDSQIRHCFLYVFRAAGDLDDLSLNKHRPVNDSDAELTLRICSDAKSGTLKEHHKLLNVCGSRRGATKVIEARYLPFLGVVLSNDKWRRENENWIRQQLAPQGSRPRISDSVVVKFLRRILQSITA